MHTMQARHLTRNQIRREMKARRLYQEDVARRAGEHQTTVSRVFNRDPRVSADRVARVWAALDAMLAEFPPIAGRRDRQAATGAA